MHTISAEFTIPEHYPTDRRGAVRWIYSHAIRQWPMIIGALIGAFGNAAMMAVIPVLLEKGTSAARDLRTAQECLDRSRSEPELHQAQNVHVPPAEGHGRICCRCYFAVLNQQGLSG